jgi:hypothetical protein
MSHKLFGECSEFYEGEVDCDSGGSCANISSNKRLSLGNENTEYEMCCLA